MTRAASTSLRARARLIVAAVVVVAAGCTTTTGDDPEPPSSSVLAATEDALCDAAIATGDTTFVLPGDDGPEIYDMSGCWDRP